MMKDIKHQAIAPIVSIQFISLRQELKREKHTVSYDSSIQISQSYEIFFY